MGRFNREGSRSHGTAGGEKEAVAAGKARKRGTGERIARTIDVDGL
jgi:hypothetical protein